MSLDSTVEDLVRQYGYPALAGVIIASMRLLLGIADPATSAHLRPSNTGLTEWEHDPDLGSWILRSYNETDLLIGLARPERPDDEAIVLPADAPG